MSEQEDNARTAPVVAEFLLRWQRLLVDHSNVFAQLKDEQRKGWESPALDALYKKPTDTPASAASSSSAVKETHFHNVNLEALCDRYKNHARHILTRSCPTHFQRSSDHTRTFVDLGSAPGGVSAYLIHELLWRGVGVSLAVADGGIGMSSHMAPSSTFHFLQKSILDDDLVDVVRSSLSSLSHPSTPPSDGSGVVDFVNGGAVQDHGQRGGDKNDNMEGEGPILPWFRFMAPQLLASLELVRADGEGAVMVVYGMSQCGSLFLLLHVLVVMLRIVPTFDDVDFLETMHLTKPPIYLLLKRVKPTPEALRLLRDMFIADASTDGGKSWKGLREFWTLEHDDQRLAAQDAFKACGHRLELIWSKAESYLKMRREKAEGSHAYRTALKRQRT